MNVVADTDRYLTFEEVMDRLRVSRSTLSRYIDAGLSPMFQLTGRPGGLIRIRERDLARAMSRWESRGGRR